MKLTGIEIQNFRSIGEAGVKLIPWKKCNIAIGRNNIGKSNVLRAIEKIRSVLDDPKLILQMNSLDRHNRSGNTEFIFTLHFEIDNNYQSIPDVLGSNQVEFVFSEKIGVNGMQIIDNTFARITEFKKIHDLIQILGGESLSKHNTPEQIRTYVLERSMYIFVKHFKNTIPPIAFIPEFRQIQEGDKYSLDGKNLIAELARFQNPNIGRDTDKEKFKRIELLIRQLLHLPNAILEVTRENPTIILENDGKRLPLSSYGTGVHELVILVTAIISLEEHICCIEEPEIHLHPSLQREFIEFIATETSNQYLISTHSSTLINANLTMRSNARDQIQVFHLELKDGATTGRQVIETSHSLNALNDLGVKASDLLQSNSIIWVEGPSDRIYLNQWLKLCAPELIEGLHYSIMFYGGRLLSHVSLVRKSETDSVPEELIEVLKINQRAVVLIDSDKKTKRSHINETKKRIQKECNQSESECWITHGREVENYLSANVLVAGCKEILEQKIEILPDNYEKLEDVLKKSFASNKVKGFDYAAEKVKYARIFTKHITLDDMTDNLKKQMKVVIEKIYAWNT